MTTNNDDFGAIQVLEVTKLTYYLLEGETLQQTSQFTPPKLVTTITPSSALLRTRADHLQKLFRPAEMQVVVAALFHNPCDPEQVVDRIRDAVDQGSGVVESIIGAFEVDKRALCGKLSTLGPRSTFVIADAINQLRRLPRYEALELGGLPSVDALRCVGLVAPQGPLAWGYCVVRPVGYSFVQAYVLTPTPAEVTLSPSAMTVDELAFEAVELTRLSQAGSFGDDEFIRGFSTCYHLAAKTGWRHFRIEEREDRKSAKVVQIPREALVSDLRNGSFHEGGSTPLVLAGLNAPDFSATPAEEAAALDSPESRPSTEA